MKISLLVMLLLFSNLSFACGKGGIPIDIEARLHSLDKTTIELKISAPKRYGKYKFSSAAYHKGKNLIPMNKGLSDLGKIFYFLKGTAEFFNDSSIKVAYTYGIDQILCSYKESLNLNNAIKTATD